MVDRRRRLIELISGLCELYSKHTSKFVFEMYYQALADFTTQQVEKAIFKVIKTHKYNTLPKPADIIEMIQGTTEDVATDAWFKLREGMRKAGYYKSVEFDDPIISHCIQELGGWMELCSVPIRELTFIEQRFKKYYRVFKLREVKRPIPVLGFFEVNNTAGGFESSRPVRIGFKNNKRLIRG